MKSYKVVSWYGKFWNQFTKQDLQNLDEHMKTFDCSKKRDDYIKYLQNWVKMPKEIYGLSEKHK